MQKMIISIAIMLVVVMIVPAVMAQNFGTPVTISLVNTSNDTIWANTLVKRDTTRWLLGKIDSTGTKVSTNIAKGGSMAEWLHAPADTTGFPVVLHAYSVAVTAIDTLLVYGGFNKRPYVSVQVEDTVTAVDTLIFATGSGGANSLPDSAMVSRTGWACWNIDSVNVRHGGNAVRDSFYVFGTPIYGVTKMVRTDSGSTAVIGVAVKKTSPDGMVPVVIRGPVEVRYQKDGVYNALEYGDKIQAGINGKAIEWKTAFAAGDTAGLLGTSVFTSWKIDRIIGSYIGGSLRDKNLANDSTLIPIYFDKP